MFAFAIMHEGMLVLISVKKESERNEREREEEKGLEMEILWSEQENNSS